MTTETYASIAFYIFAAVIVVAALAVVLLPRIVHAALALVLFFFSVSGLYVLLGAPFIAATQIIVYVGAITVLFLFAIMLTHRSYSADSNQPNRQWIAGAVVAALVFVTILWTLLQTPFPANPPATPGGVTDVTFTLGQLLMGPFLVPFEVVGLLLLSAMIGAIVVAREQ